MTNLFRKVARLLLTIFAPIAIIAMMEFLATVALAQPCPRDYGRRDLPESAIEVPDDVGSLCRAVPTGELRNLDDGAGLHYLLRRHEFVALHQGVGVSGG